MLKVFGTKSSRASRALWMCRELGIPHEHVEVHFADGSNQTAQFLAVNPNGKIPAIDDDGFCLWESMAINIYLAKKHGSPLLPNDLQQEMQVLQWSFWVMTEVEKPLLTVMLQRLGAPRGRAGGQVPARAQSQGSSRRTTSRRGAGQATQHSRKAARGPRLSARRELHGRRSERGLSAGVGVRCQARPVEPAERAAMAQALYFTARHARLGALL